MVKVKMLLVSVLMKQRGACWQSQWLSPLGIHSRKKAPMAAVLKLIRFGRFACMSCEENATMMSVLGSMPRTMVMETLLSISTLILIMEVYKITVGNLYIFAFRSCCIIELSENIHVHVMIVICIFGVFFEAELNIV